MPQIPTDLLNQLGVALELIVAVLTATLVALWVGLAIWTLRDIHARTRDIFAWILATLLVVVTGPLGLLLYLLVRPRETLAEVYDRQLEEEALMRDITTRRACPSCQTVTEADWLVCPRCRTELRRRCAECGAALDLDWVVCPHCTAAVPGAPSASLRGSLVATKPSVTLGRQPVVAEPAPANGSQAEELEELGEPAA